MDRGTIYRLITGVGLAVLAMILVVGLPRGSEPYWYSVVPPVLAVGLALLTRQVLLSLGLAVLVGGLLTTLPGQIGSIDSWREGLSNTARFLANVFIEHRDGAVIGPDWGRIQIFLFVTTMLAAVMVMVASGGLQGVINLFTRFARGPRSTQVVTAFTGCLVFIDDYANTMIVGNAMRPLSDQNRVSREKLAFLVDATSAPIAGVALLSTWIGFEVGLFDDQRKAFGLGISAYEMFLMSLPFYFYCFLMLGFVFVVAATGKDFGPMVRAERRARSHSDGAAEGHPLTSGGPDPEARVRAISALLPLTVLFGVMLSGLWISGGQPGSLSSPTAWREAMGEADINLVLLLSSSSCLVVASVMALGVSGLSEVKLLKAVLAGLRGSLLPLGILILAGALQNVCDKGGLNTGQFLGELIQGRLPIWMFPLLVFLISGATAFATGTSWGTMGILIPIVFPIAYSLDGSDYGLITMISLAAVLDGAIFGDHCSPISDTTIMSSTASGCDLISHVQTQFPYSVVVASLALGCGYLPTVLGAPSWLGLVMGIGAIGTLFALLPRWVESSSGPTGEPEQSRSM